MLSPLLHLLFLSRQDGQCLCLCLHTQSLWVHERVRSGILLVHRLVQLHELIKCGTGFIVSLTPEYIEGTAHKVNPEVARRLHRGYFSIQAHIDLHGFGVNDAHQAFDGFLNKSIEAGKRAVLIIHGRGLSSPYEPVLKTKVYQWLTAAPWHKWVIAFASARLCDGGAGATYVLLRQQPLTKRFRKQL
jgi:DNA-nicking Smr family endonuclease